MLTSDICNSNKYNWNKYLMIISCTIVFALSVSMLICHSKQSNQLFLARTIFCTLTHSFNGTGSSLYSRKFVIFFAFVYPSFFHWFVFGQHVLHVFLLYRPLRLAPHNSNTNMLHFQPIKLRLMLQASHTFATMIEILCFALIFGKYYIE